MKKSPVVLFLLVAMAEQVYSICEHKDFLHDLAVKESSLNPVVTNAYGYIGLFQMGEAALQDAGYYKGDTTKKNDWSGTWSGKNGINSKADFLNNPDAQVQAIVTYHNQLQNQIKKLGFDKYIGQNIGGSTITLSGLVAGAHLVGMGNLQKFINSGGGVVPSDGNNTPITTYISQFGGCELTKTSPGFAAIKTSGGGAGIGVIPEVPPGSVVGGGISPIGLSAGSAFKMGAGIDEESVNVAIVSILMMLLVTWLAWTSIAHFGAWRRRQLTGIAVQKELLRGAIIIAIISFIVY